MSSGTEEDRNKIRAGIEQISSIHTLHSLLGVDAELHLVGGSVRDLLLGKEKTDIDLATRLKPESIREVLEKNGIRVIPTGIEHGTITALIEDEPIEITTYRKPSARIASEYSDSIEKDLEGRDFTINAIAYSLDQEEIVDPFGGVEDLSNSILRAVISAEERITEDPARILRMIRFGAAENREVDPELLTAATKHKELLNNIAVERIQTEFSKIIVSKFVRKALEQLVDTGIAETVFPEILPTIGVEQNEFHVEDVFQHTLTVTERAEPILPLRLAALFHDIGKAHTLTIGDDGRRHFYRHEEVSADTCKDVLERLKYSKEINNTATTLVRLHMRPLDCGPAGVRRLIRDLGPNMELWLKLKYADAPPVVPEEEFLAQLNNFKEMLAEEERKQEGPAYGKLAINGHDLIKLGIKPGPEMGEILSKIEEAVIEDPSLNEYEILAEKVKKLNE